VRKIAAQIRQQIIEMIYSAQSGHPAGSLGMTDVFTVLYFGQILKFKPQEPFWEERDYLILSNGHICPVLYACLAKAGFFAETELKTFRQFNSRLQGHPHLGSPPGVENTAGPLGQGLSQAVGVALGLKMEQKTNHVFCVTSDGEHQEGQTWESYMLAAKYKLNNLTVLIDRNQIQIGGPTEEIMPIEPLKYKLASFGFDVAELDGHNFEQLVANLKQTKKQLAPTAIICHTIPGKGVSFMENNFDWHGKAPNQNEFEQAMKELKNYE